MQDQQNIEVIREVCGDLWSTRQALAVIISSFESQLGGENFDERNRFLFGVQRLLQMSFREIKKSEDILNNEFLEKKE